MPPKKSAPKASTKPNDIDSLFAGIENDISKDSSSGKPRTSTSLAPDDDEKALLAEIEGLTAEHRAPSRPVTPRVGGGTPAPRASGELRRQVVTGKTTAPVKKTEEEESEEDDDDDDDEDDDDDDEEEEEDEKKVPVKGPLKKKVEAAPQSQQQQQGGGGGWWGGIWNTASTAVSAAQSTAQTVYKEIQASEEAQRWTQQVKGSLEGVKELSGELQKRAIPTFTSILQHIAPPISQHERLHIHTTHDLQNYPSLDPLIHQVFARVMQQVEGGDLLVIQRGSESTSKQNTLNTSTWNGGPWWRDERKRELGVVKGLEAGIKLAKATADGYSGEYAQRSPVQEKTFEDPENPVRKSDIFLAVQAVNFASPWTSVLLKAAAAATDNEDDGEDAEEAEEVLGFVVHLYDPKHGLQFTTMSQTCPAKWGDWMDAEFEELPEDVQMGLANGAVDPREWIAEWMEETLLLAVGIIAQSYVSKRMGVGEGLGKGKEVVGRTEVNVGEEARVL